MTLKTVDTVTAGRTEQLGRRNLTDEQRTVLIGKMYEARKHSRGNTTSTRAEDGTFQCTQNGNNGEQPQRVSDQIAQELGITKNTVIRAEKFSKGLDKIAEVSPEAEQSRKEVTLRHHD